MQHVLKFKWHENVDGEEWWSPGLTELPYLWLDLLVTLHSEAMFHILNLIESMKVHLEKQGVILPSVQSILTTKLCMVSKLRLFIF